MHTLETESLKRILSSRDFLPVDQILVETLESEYSETNPWVLLAAAMTSMLVRNGHAYHDLSNPEHYYRLSQATPIDWPEITDWQTLLQKSPACSTEDTYLPLILDQSHRLYLQRYFQHENAIATSIRSLTNKPSESTSNETNTTEEIPDTVFEGLHHLQKTGIQEALQNRFFIITGGPGTGKTTTVLRYLIARLSLSEHPEFLRIGVAAPTGKAAARLAESFINGLDSAPAPEEIKELLKVIPCQTIHRMLGSLPGLSTFRHDAHKPLPFDIIVVDEASMIDLPLMRRFLDALPKDAILLLLGDADQLSSVNVGSVLKDLLEAGQNPESPLSQNICQLTQTFRFDESSGIFHLCNAIRRDDQPAIIETLSNNPFSDLTIELGDDSQNAFKHTIDKGFQHWKAIDQSTDVDSALTQLNAHTILTTQRRGKHGTEELNRAIAQKVRNSTHADSHQEFFHAMPIIILENNYDTELYNGDLGLIWIHPKDGTPKAYFPDANGKARSFPLSSLPRHEAAFALTIHKSQGSEFSDVTVFLSETHEAHLSKELIYTAFSRARKTLTIAGDKLALLKGISTTVNRATGLADKLK